MTHQVNQGTSRISKLQNKSVTCYVSKHHMRQFWVTLNLHWLTFSWTIWCYCSSHSGIFSGLQTSHVWTKKGAKHIFPNWFSQFPSLTYINRLGGHIHLQNGLLQSTHINGCIGLDVVHVWVGQTQLLTASLHWADDSWCDCILQSKGASHGDHKLSLSNIRRLPEGECG